MSDYDNVLMEVEEDGIIRFLYKRKREDQPDAEIHSLKNGKIKVEDWQGVEK